MSSLSVKEKAALLQSGFSKGFSSLNNNANRRNKMAANLGGLPMTSANNNSWNNNNNNKGNNWNNAMSNNGEIPGNLFVSPPGSPTGLNNNSGSNVGSVVSALPAAAVAANAVPADPYAITPNKMAKAKAKFNKINANKRAAANAAAAAAASPVAVALSKFSPFNMYTGLSASASTSSNQEPVYGPYLQAVMAKAFSKGASEAAKTGADYAGQQAAGRAAAEYAKVMQMTETNASGKVHYPGVEAEAANKASAAAKAANARKTTAANPVAPAKHWGTVQTGHRGAHRKSCKNRRSGSKSRKNRK